MSDLSLSLLTRLKQKSIRIKSAREKEYNSSQANQKNDASYNPHQYPANLQDAKNHGRARRVSIPRFLYEELKGKPYPYEEIDACNCCGFEIQNE